MTGRRAVDLGIRDASCRGRFHGTVSAYKNGCRCPHAREAKRLYFKRRREGRAEPRRIARIGTVRRLQALAALGWRWVDLAAELGVSWQNVQWLVIRTGDLVDVSTAVRVDAVYRRLVLTVGPSEATRRRARAKGWAPPLAWDDDIDDPEARPRGVKPEPRGLDWAAIERCLEAGGVRLRPVERVEAIRKAAGWGWPDSKISTRVGVTVRSVLRTRTKHGIRAGVPLGTNQNGVAA